PFVIAGTSRWSRRLAVLIELTLGILYTPGLFIRSFLRRKTRVTGRALRVRVWCELTMVLVVWGVVVAAAAWSNALTFLLVLYGIPALIAGNMQSLRKYIEHMGLTGSTV